MQDRITQISDRIEDLAEPLAARRERIQTAKAFHQLRRDLQDEILWCQDRRKILFNLGSFNPQGVGWVLNF